MGLGRPRLKTGDSRGRSTRSGVTCCPSALRSGAWPPGQDCRSPTRATPRVRRALWPGPRRGHSVACARDLPGRLGQARDVCSGSAGPACRLGSALMPCNQADLARLVSDPPRAGRRPPQCRPPRRSRPSSPTLPRCTDGPRTPPRPPVEPHRSHHRLRGPGRPRRRSRLHCQHMRTRLLTSRALASAQPSGRA
jgi:hypothetical protein